MAPTFLLLYAIKNAKTEIHADRWDAIRLDDFSGRTRSNNSGRELPYYIESHIPWDTLLKLGCTVTL